MGGVYKMAEKTAKEGFIMNETLKTGEGEMEFSDRVLVSIRLMGEKCHGYKPTLFLKMIDEYGAVEAVKRLINNPKVADGFTKLWECKHLELSMENIIQEKEWHDLFTDDERGKAKERLSDYGFSE